MAEKILIMGESGTGKSTSLRNCDPTTTAIVNPVGKPLPFKGKFDMLNAVTDATSIVTWMKKQVASGKKVIVVDDFQYILSIPYMNRIKEGGWDKWNDFGANYFELIDVCKKLPEDVTVFYLTHTETLDDGVTTIKLIGKLLREKITIEGLFTIVLRTSVIDGKYYFLTQNSGKDTVKSPMGMFPTYAIDNDLKYVDDKIRNYYQIGEYIPDDQMQEADKGASAGEVSKPDANGRRPRARKDAAAEKPGQPESDQPDTGKRTRRSRGEVEKDNAAKMEDYVGKCAEAAEKAAGDKDSVPLDEAEKEMDKVPKPELEKVPRRTRRSRA